MVEKIEVFICYAHKDESLMSELKNQLASLEPQELITIWHDRMIAGGTDWKKEIDSHLNSANIILLLVSSNFTASQYSQVEVKRAMERYTAGEVQVIPVILRPVMWKSSAFGKLSPLPKDGKPVTSSNWSNHDEAWIDVAEGVQKAIDELRKPVVPIEKPGSSDPPQDSSHKEQQLMTQNTKDEKFDVFLCYNSKDEVEVRGIAIQLRDKGIKPWFDKWELRPGTSWQDALQKQIGQINTVAVFVGKGGVGPWQDQELNAYIRKFVNKGSQVIPVLLGDASQMPARPVFLEGLEYVDFRKPETEPMKHLIWGITGENPNVETSTTVQNGLPTPKPSSGLTSQKRHVLEEELKDLMKVDFAIITMLPEEFDAILARFPHTPYTHPTSQQPYGISQVQTKGGKNRLVAMARTTRQGSDASQQLANRMITDLNPQTLLVVGIGGGVPDTDFTLGDVIVSSDIRNF